MLRKNGKEYMANKMNHLTKFTDFSAPFYDIYFKLWLWHETDFRQKVVDLMDLAGNESVSDVGCGTGTLTSMVADKMDGRGGISGVDLSPKMVEVAKKKASRNRRQVEYRVTSSHALPFYDETFNIVVASLLYHHLMSLEEKAKTLSEIQRVLKPEGKYIAAEFSKFTVANLWITHDLLIQKTSLFGTELLEENRFHIAERWK